MGGLKLVRREVDDLIVKRLVLFIVSKVIK